MSIEIKCQCGSDYRLDDNRAGEEFSCRVCGASITLPAGAGRATPQPTPAPTPEAATVIGEATHASAAATTAEPPKATAPAAQTPTSTPTVSPWESVGESLGGPSTTASAPAAVPVTPPQPVNSTDPTDPASPSWSPVFSTASEPAGTASKTLRPPMSWCAVRVILWGICVGFLFMPWFSLSGANQQSGELVTESITGWTIVSGVAEGLAKAGASGGPKLTGGGLREFTEVPDGAGVVVAGGMMLLLGPCVYALGLILTLPLGVISYLRSGRGAIWGFIISFAGLVGFVAGWRMIAGAEPFSEMLEVASQVGVSIGPSAWAWTMTVAMIFICLIARAKPDYNLIRAMQWSEERSNAGPL